MKTTIKLLTIVCVLLTLVFIGLGFILLTTLDPTVGVANGLALSTCYALCIDGLIF